MNWPGNCQNSGLYTTAAEKNEIPDQAFVILTLIFRELQPVNRFKLSFVNNGYTLKIWMKTGNLSIRLLRRGWEPHKKGLGPGVPGKLYSKHFKATRLVAMFSYILLFGVFVEIINL